MTRREDFEDLEGELDDMGSKYLRAKARLRKTDERVAALTEQRDAALEACRVLQEEVLTLQRAVGVGDGPRMHEADALIAKAKEVTP